MDGKLKMTHTDDYIDGVKWAAAISAGLWAALPSLFLPLVAMMVLDIFFRVIAGIYNKDLSPQDIWWSVTRKMASLILVGAAMILSFNIPQNLGVDIAQVACAFYLVGELVSITKYASLIGVLVPPQIGQIIDYFEGFSGGKKDEDETDIFKNPERS